MGTPLADHVQGKCALIHDDHLERLSDAQLQGHLQDCINAELALMAQYLYMLSTLPALTSNHSVAEATTIRSIAKRLHILAIGEMGHAATACNLLVLFGGSPRFKGRGVAGPAAPAELPSVGTSTIHAHEFRLAPLSAEQINALLRYERRDAHSSMPLERTFVFDTPSERVGRIYRRVYYELCTRSESGHPKDILADQLTWAPFADQQSSKPSTSILPRPHNGVPDHYHYDEILWALYKVLTEGEGGVEAADGPDLSHVDLLQSISANLALLDTSRRDVLIDPSVHDPEMSVALQQFARAGCHAYEVTLASLYVLWLRDLDLAERQRFYFALTGFMAVVFAGVAVLIAQTPVRDGQMQFIGPTFETLRAISAPTSRRAASAQIAASIGDLQRALAMPAVLPHGSPEVPWYRERLRSLEAPVARYLEQVTALGERG